jgi:hypothetical protein
MLCPLFVAHEPERALLASNSVRLSLMSSAMPNRIFLLSPASCSGRRAEILLRERAAFDLAVRLRSGTGVTLGEAFSFLSGLYFRGKLAYASPLRVRGRRTVSDTGNYRRARASCARNQDHGR